jgi:hypothetical protein
LNKTVRRFQAYRKVQNLDTNSKCNKISKTVEIYENACVLIQKLVRQWVTRKWFADRGNVCVYVFMYLFISNMNI